MVHCEKQQARIVVICAQRSTIKLTFVLWLPVCALPSGIFSATFAVLHCSKKQLTHRVFLATLPPRFFRTICRVYQALEIGDRKTQSPSTWDSALELPRVVLEMTSLTYAWPLLATSPRGDGHAVFCLPGFTAGDQSLLVLRRFLNRLNYHTLPWQLGQNIGSYELQDQLLEHFQHVMADNPGKISLIGQSLGGIYARMLARRWPERIRQVITLSSPFASASPESTNALVGRLFRYLSGMSRAEMREQMQADPARALPVPSTAIYTKTDGVVHWHTCLDYTGEQAENIEVLGSHSGMGFNPLVLHVLADRLAQPEDHWQPFERTQGCRGFMFPKPATRVDVDARI